MDIHPYCQEKGGKIKTAAFSLGFRLVCSVLLTSFEYDYLRPTCDDLMITTPKIVSHCPDAFQWRPLRSVDYNK